MESKDTAISEAGIMVRVGRKWNAGKALVEARWRLQQKEIVGAVAHGKLGIGLIEKPRWHKADKEERRELLQNEVRFMEEEDRQVEAVSMCKQGRWTKWDGVRKLTLAWKDIWSMAPARLSFMLKAVHHV
jgi:hypothetical protein